MKLRGLDSIELNDGIRMISFLDRWSLRFSQDCIGECGRLEAPSSFRRFLTAAH